MNKYVIFFRVWDIFNENKDNMFHSGSVASWVRYKKNDVEAVLAVYHRIGLLDIVRKKDNGTIKKYYQLNVKIRNTQKNDIIKEALTC